MFQVLVSQLEVTLKTIILPLSHIKIFIWPSFCLCYSHQAREIIEDEVSHLFLFLDWRVCPTPTNRPPSSPALSTGRTEGTSMTTSSSRWSPSQVCRTSPVLNRSPPTSRVSRSGEWSTSLTSRGRFSPTSFTFSTRTSRTTSLLDWGWSVPLRRTVTTRETNSTWLSSTARTRLSWPSSSTNAVWR